MGYDLNHLVLYLLPKLNTTCVMHTFTRLQCGSHKEKSMLWSTQEKQIRFWELKEERVKRRKKNHSEGSFVNDNFQKNGGVRKG